MDISIIGLGYVGSVGAACLSELGHQITGIDIDSEKVARLERGKSSIVEQSLDMLLTRHVESGRIRGTTDTAAAVADTDLIFITVGTPSLPSGEPDLRPLHSVCRDIHAGLAHRTRTDPLIVVVRSTVPPGTMRGVVVPFISGDRFTHGKEFLVGSNPEFLREGSAVSDFMHASFCLLGADHRQCLDRMREVYTPLDTEIMETDLESAELVKYASNAFHALKVCFANEIGTLANELGIDGRAVMEMFCRDRVLNISPKYLKPGFSYGGSCLPKDVRALNALARHMRVEAPMLASVALSNDAHTQRGLDLIHELGKRRISLFGLAFKRGTADLRSSPLLFMLEHLQARDYDVLVHDSDVEQALDNDLYPPEQTAKLRSFMVSFDEAAAHAEVAVIGKNSGMYGSLHERIDPSATLVDLAGQYEHAPANVNYTGICWDNRSPQGDKIAEELSAGIEAQTGKVAPLASAGKN